MERFRTGEETLVFGDGEQTRDYVYVADVVDAVLAAAGRGGVYNVGTATETTVNELHRLCAAIAGVEREPRHVEPRAGDARRSVLDAGAAGRELGWRARVSLDEGLRRTWASLG
jgi:UDP-glucose 4-epimerase